MPLQGGIGKITAIRERGLRGLFLQEFLQVCPDGFAGAWYHPVCSNFSEWLQYKESLAHTGVRDTESGTVQNQIIHEQDVDINRSAALTVMLLRTPQAYFNILGQFKELLRGAIPESCDCTIGKAGCARMTADRFALQAGGHLQIRYTAIKEHFAGALKGRRGLTEIASKSQSDPFACMVAHC